jgi:hypothetical protein
VEMSVFREIKEKAMMGGVVIKQLSPINLRHLIDKIKKAGGQYGKDENAAEIGEDENYFDSKLMCPRNKGCMADNNLHQEALICIWRDQEDGDGTLIASSSSQVIVERVKDKEIAGRRDVMYVVFTCECEKIRILEILQHKGHTYVTWRHDLVEAL